MEGWDTVSSFHIAWHLMRRTLGRKWSLIIFMVLPSLVAFLIIGLFNRDDVIQMRVMIVNHDQGFLGDLLQEQLGKRQLIQVEPALSQEEARNILDRQKAEALMIIPDHFTSDLLAGRLPEKVILETRLQDRTVRLNDIVKQELANLAETVQLVRLQSGTSSQNGTGAKIKAVYTLQREKGASFEGSNRVLAKGQVVGTSMGLLLMFIMSFISSSISVLDKDRLNKTMLRVYSAPVRPSQIAAGNLLGCFLLGTLQILVVLLFTRIGLRFDYGIKFLPLLLILESFLLAAIGLSAAVTGLMKPGTANVVSSLVITPTCMLGGCFWPVYIMPEYMQKLSGFVPQRWAIDAITRLSVGAPLSSVMFQIGILLLFGVVLLSFGMAVLRPGAEERTV